MGIPYMTVSRIVSGPTHETALAAGKDLGRTPESGIFSVTHEMGTHKTALIQNKSISNDVDVRLPA
jgi:hypothetical protein